MTRPKMKPGDLLTFKSATRSHYKQATRVIVSVDYLGRPCVRYHGWDNFVVHFDEIISVERAAK
jgi:hypothetical protein